MIAFSDHTPTLDDSLIGCRMQTIDACYSALPSGPDWYKCDAGGVLCRFGDALLLAGCADFAELFSFAEALGVTRIEWVSEGPLPYTLPGSWTSGSYPLLHCTGEPGSYSENIEINHELRHCFELLSQSDAQFAREAEYLPWLSDMTRRRTAGRAETFMVNDAAVACITAKGRRSAYLSSVAVRPGQRGKGLGLALVRAVVTHPASQGMTIYTAAQRESLTAFYEQASFLALPQHLTIIEKRDPA